MMKRGKYLWDIWGLGIQFQILDFGFWILMKCCAFRIRCQYFFYPLIRFSSYPILLHVPGRFGTRSFTLPTLRSSQSKITHQSKIRDYHHGNGRAMPAAQDFFVFTLAQMPPTCRNMPAENPSNRLPAQPFTIFETTDLKHKKISNQLQ